jgi:signal transduction histidine kinase
MTKNEPELKMHAAIPVQLSFFYDSVGHKIVFSSSSPDIFFGAPLDTRHVPPFLRAFDNKHSELLIAEWQACLQLQENEAKNFTVITTRQEFPLLFLFTVAKPASSLNINSSLLMISVTRMRLNDVAQEEPVAQSSRTDKYAEFIELAAHDLDSPLRKLSVLLEKISNRYEPNTEKDSKGYFLRARASLEDMRSLIEKLTQLTRLTNTPIKRVECDLDSIIQTAINDHVGQLAGRDANFRLNSLPVIKGDSGQIKQLFDNILSNAFTFRKKEWETRIEIFSEAVTDNEKKFHNLPGNSSYVKVIVSDNGIGFRQEDAEKIFQPFVRLNGKSEYPGSGIGLAISRKIVENHGGIIYAHGEENLGAKFILLLPLS